MRVYFKVCLVLAIVFVLNGCYKSKVPMASSKGSTIDANLLGKWKEIVTEDDTKPADILVLSFNDNEYYVEYQKEKKVTRCRAYIVMVEGAPFINVQLIEEDERPFVFYRYSLSKDDILTLKMVSADFVKTQFKSSKELYEFIKKNLKNEKLYEKPVRFKSYDNSTATAKSSPHGNKYFKIQVIDEQTGRGVPLVELKTVNNVRYYTDSNGIVAFYEPSLLNKKVFFHVKSHGYQYPKDGFGYRGKTLKLIEGGSAVLRVKRISLAERLYRVTGAGIYRDSMLVSHPVPIDRPTLNGLVFGSDSVLNTIYQDKIYWFWGDTNRPGYPLGNFDVTGATSLLPGKGGLDPEKGVNLNYFTRATGFVKPMAPVEGKGPTWIDGVVTVRDSSARERMFAAYAKIKPGSLEAYERGLVEFNDQKQQFEKVLQFELDSPVRPYGHPVFSLVDGVEYIYFANPYPLTRVRASPEYLKNLSEYESYTCLKTGTRLDDYQLDRSENGSIRYNWKKNTPPVTPKEQAKLIQLGKLKKEEALLQLQDVDTGKSVIAHSGSVYWNKYRKRWVMITVEIGGSSYLGEIWYAEADTILGPWVYARKVVTHDKYSFYNPKQHPMFDKDDGRIIFFEGTYSNFLSGAPDKTPWYNYNQIMYKLDLSDQRLVLPVPVYQLSDEATANNFCTLQHLEREQQPRKIAFFAMGRPGKLTVPVYVTKTPKGYWTFKVGSTLKEKEEHKPLFYVLSADTKNPPVTTVPLYEFVHENGTKRVYSTNREFSIPGYQKPGQLICLVWNNPYKMGYPGK